jgi:hypothetical protein
MRTNPHVLACSASSPRTHSAITELAKVFLEAVALLVAFSYREHVPEHDNPGS